MYGNIKFMGYTTERRAIKLKKRFFIALSILSLLLLGSCDLLGGSLTEYVAEYTHSAAIELHNFTTNLPRTADGATCLNSDGSVILYLRNPMKYNVSFDYMFKNEDVQTYFLEHYGASSIQFTSMIEDNSAYKMTFPASFITDVDSCAITNEEGPVKDISGSVIAYETETLRPFGSYELTLRADTVPNSVGSALLQLDADNTNANAKYVVCFMIEKSTFNYDFDTIQINSETWNVSFQDGNIRVAKKGSPKGELIVNPATAPAVYPLQVDGGTFKTQSGYDIFYYFSPDIRSDSETSYKITITDKAGLTATANVSSRTEKLTPVVISANPTDGQLITASDAGFYTLIITHDGKSVKGEDLPGKVTISCTIEKDGAEPETIRGDSPFTVTLPLGTSYHLTANATCPNCLSNTDVQTNTFSVIHSSQFFVSATGSDDANGTASAPYKTFNKCIDDIIQWKETYGEPENGVFINVLSDITPASTDFATYKVDYGKGPVDVYQDRLINNHSLSTQKTLDGKTTIRGADANGNAQNRTINAQGSADLIANRGVFSWTGNSTLTVENLTFTGGYGTDFIGAGAYIFAGMTSSAEPETINATFKNCTFEGNAIAASGDSFSGGAGLAVNAGYDESSRIILTDCVISNNKVTGLGAGAGILISTFNDNASSGILELKGNTSVKENTSEANAAGIYSNGNLVIDSASVVISDNICGEYDPKDSTKGYGAGLYADFRSTLTIRGATITDNKTSNDHRSNLYLAGLNDDARLITIAGDLTGSRIGVSSATQPLAEGYAPSVFTRFTSAYKPANDIFLSDFDIPIKISDTEAKFSFTGSAEGSGFITYPIQFHDDILMQMEYGGDEELYFIFAFTDSANNPIDDAKITGCSVICDEDVIEESDSTWCFDGNTLILNSNFIRIISQAGSLPSITVFFEYNGFTYSGSLPLWG